MIVFLVRAFSLKSVYMRLIASVTMHTTPQMANSFILLLLSIPHALYKPFVQLKIS